MSMNAHITRKQTVKVLALIFILLTGAAMKLSDKAPQSRIGVVSMSSLMEQLPAYRSAVEDLDTLKQQLEAQLHAKVTAYDQKLKDFEANKENLARLVAEDKKAELEQMQASIQAFHKASNEELADKEDKLMIPVWKSIEAAIAAVAREKGYTHVINSDQPSPLLLYLEEETQIDGQVLVKLGIGVTH